MRSPKVHCINESDHFTDYAEMPSFNWEDRVTERLRKDEEKAALFGAAVCLGIVLLLVYAVPWIWRMWR